MVNSRFALQQLTSIEWIVVDESCTPNDPQRTVACIYEVDTLEYDVIWLRDLGLATKFMSPLDVIDEIVRTTQRSTVAASRKPVPIPHHAPQQSLAG